jgi:hypothetical protein
VSGQSTKLYQVLIPDTNDGVFASRPDLHLRATRK